MNFIRTKDLLQEACYASDDVHQMTDDERTKLQHHLLGMYNEIEAVCVKHNLTVMLAYGSVLGAIRHGGFIPWDDDLDLFMPRQDYELFINEYADELPSHLRVYAPNSKNGTFGRFAKVIDINTKFIPAGVRDNGSPKQGIFVDIFPLDSIKKRPFRNKISRFVGMAMMYIGESVGRYKAHSKLFRQLMMHSTTTKINYWFRQTIGFLFSFIGYQKWMNLVDSFCANDNQTGYVSDLMGDYTWNPIPVVEFFPPTIGKFEGRNVFLPHQPIKHLERYYGNWQRIPPEEERWLHFIREIRFENKKPLNEDC
ncbi:MAG: LicD family protein [Muribaculaceae bacterium]|nr:LicD family protein [Muribaculaceae bacterium]